jgi:hypothetical protein
MCGADISEEIYQKIMNSKEDNPKPRRHQGKDEDKGQKE